MKNVKDQINSEYLSTLISVLSGAGEVGLQRAYELGRSALDEKLSLLQVADAYVHALTEVLAPNSPEDARVVAATRELLSTSLAPFEMTQRGFQESVEKLTLVNRELETFSYAVSHDLRAPLRSIGEFTKIILEDYKKQFDEKGREHLGRIVDSVHRMEQLIEGLLLLSQFDHQEITRRPVNLSRISLAIIQDFQRASPTRKVEVVIAENVTVRGDERLLHVVMTNLLRNAWKFTAKVDRARIEFGMSVQSGKPVYFVKDNGAGFDMKSADKLFGPFQRFHSAAQFEGTGVGLATVRRIVQRHEGRIWAEAQINQGATFYFTLSPAGH